MLNRIVAAFWGSFGKSSSPSHRSYMWSVSLFVIVTNLILHQIPFDICNNFGAFLLLPGKRYSSQNRRLHCSTVTMAMLLGCMYVAGVDLVMEGHAFEHLHCLSASNQFSSGACRGCSQPGASFFFFSSWYCGSSL